MSPDVPRPTIVATEFVVTSIIVNGSPYEVFGRALPENPHIRFRDSRRAATCP